MFHNIAHCVASQILITRNTPMYRAPLEVYVFHNIAHCVASQILITRNITILCRPSRPKHLRF